MIKVINLKKNYRDHEVLKGISFEIGKGAVYGFLGQNGAGKSTTMNILTGLIGFNGGEIYIDGKDFKIHRNIIMKKIGYMPENPVYYEYMNAMEYLGFIGKLREYPSDKISKRVEELLEMVKLKEASKRRVGGYSRGMKQRLALAVSMFSHPEILFLDEPTSALDPEGRMDMMELIEELKKRGITVFLSTHILNDVERVCDEVSILHEGKILLSENLEELENKYVQPIYDIEFEKNCEDVKNALKKLDFVNEIKMEGKKRLSVYVKEVNGVKNEILKEIAASSNHVISYELRKNNLEDIFIRMVRSNGDL